MAGNAVHAQAEASEVPVRPVLEVLLLYEDLGTALRARQSLDELPGQLGGETGLDTRLWRLDLLGQPLLAEQAALEAAAADVIILSLHGRKELRAEVRDWLSRWLHHKEARPYALAALLDSEPARPDGDNPVIAYLKRITANAGVDLFCSSGPVPVPHRTQPLADTASAFC